jgi:hypothetical protein
LCHNLYAIYKLDSKRMHVCSDMPFMKTFFTLPMEWTRSNDINIEIHDIMTLAYPILSTLMGNIFVDFEHMWGWGQGASQAHHEFCNETLPLSLTDLNEHEQLNKLEYANSITRVMNSNVVNDGRLYICII